MNSPLRIGLLGAAAISPAAMIRPAQVVPGVQVVAVAARDPARARAFAAEHGVSRVLPDYPTLIADPEVDAIYNALPNSLHAPWSLRALAAAKHVLCEKPLTSNAAEVETLHRAAIDSGRVLAEAMHYRHHPVALRAKAIVDSGELGRVQRIESAFCVPVIRRRDIRFEFALAGGATMDLGCYCIHLIRLLSGAEPEVVSARALVREPEIDRQMEAEFRLPGGVTAGLRCAMRALTWPAISARVVGERGELRIRNPFVPQKWNGLRVRTAAGTRTESITREPTFNFQLRVFLAAVQGAGPNLTDARDALATMRVIDAVYRAAGLRPRGSAA